MVLLRMEPAQITDTDYGGAHHAGRVGAHKPGSVASYGERGLQQRIALVYSHARGAMHFVTMARYAFFDGFKVVRYGSRLVAGALAQRHCARVRLRPVARAHILRRRLCVGAL